MAVTNVAGERRKELGAFYTPPELVRALTLWAIRTGSDRVLEPAAGEAAFLKSALRRLRLLGAAAPSEQVLGIEIDSDAWASARTALTGAGEACRIVRGDFFEFPPEKEPPFTVAIGNPPYIRYQRFRGEARQRGKLAAAAAGVSLSGLASSWAPFVIHAAQFLAADGRLAFVLPAELLHADYAGPVRDYLLRRFGSVTIVTFEESVFPGASIDTILLLAEGGEQRGLRVVPLRDARQLSEIADGEQTFAVAPKRWSSVLGSGRGADALERLRTDGALRKLGDVAAVDIGFVTGANGFFVLSPAEVRERGISRRLFQPAVVRPAQLRGAIFTADDAAHLIDTDQCLVLDVTASGLDGRPTRLGRYLRHGRRLGIHRGYKCRTRSPWYSVPGIRVPDAFMSYMSNVAPRIALNSARFSSSNLVHQINFRITEAQHAHACIAALHSSAALLSFELEGRSYGGGVLKHETREAERVEFPFTERLSAPLGKILPLVDQAIRSGGPAVAADIVDALLEREGVLTAEELDGIRRSRSELLERRVRRGRSKAHDADRPDATR